MDAPKPTVEWGARSLHGHNGDYQVYSGVYIRKARGHCHLRNLSFRWGASAQHFPLLICCMFSGRADTHKAVRIPRITLMGSDRFHKGMIESLARDVTFIPAKSGVLQCSLVFRSNHDILSPAKHKIACRIRLYAVFGHFESSRVHEVFSCTEHDMSKTSSLALFICIAYRRKIWLSNLFKSPRSWRRI